MRGSATRVRCLLFAAAAVLQSIPLVAAGAPQASGTFKGSRMSFEVAGAYAYWSRTPADDQGPLISVAVSNAAFNAEAFDAFYDPEPVIDTLFADDQTAVVTFQFEPNGTYHGMSYILGPGDGCGFCYDPDVKSTVHISGGRAKGTLAFSGESRTFDVQFDVPIAPKEWGKPLPGDGGDVGNAFRAYDSAMEKGNRTAIYALLDAGNREHWDKRAKEGKLDEYVDYRVEKVHWQLQRARIVRGFVRGNQAVLVVRGSTPIMDHIHGQVALTREDGSWKIRDEVYQVGE